MFWSKKVQRRPAKKLDPKRFIKVGSLSAGIILIWTNVARTSVARTKFGQSRVIGLSLVLTDISLYIKS